MILEKGSQITQEHIDKILKGLIGVEMVFIDLFCGAGGTSTGIEQARVDGKKVAKVVLCVNHDEFATGSHEENHSDAIHLIEDVRAVAMDYLIPLIEAIRKAYPNIVISIWASLECTNFSKAKGGQPRDEDSRTLAWDLLRYQKALNPDKIFIENVEEFMAWGPLDEKGKPISKDAGEEYMKWVEAVKACGYVYEYRIINSADHGAFQSRKRFFAQFSKPHIPIRWPKSTHDKSNYRPVREVLNLKSHGESIFGRKKEFVPATLNRFYAGIIRHANPTDPNFLVKYYGKGTNAVSIDKVCPTLTTKDRIGIIYAQFLDKAYTSGGLHQSIEKPAGSVTTVNKMSLVTCQSFLINPQWGSDIGLSIDKPSPTLIARQDKAPLSLVTSENREATWIMVIQTTRKRPKPVVITKAGNLVYYISIYDTDAMIRLKFLMAHYGIVDIKMRMLDIEELLRIQGFPIGYKLLGGKCKQKWMIGNAVEVTTAREIIAANSELLVA